MNWSAYAVEQQAGGRRQAQVLVSAEEDQGGDRTPVLLNLVLDRSGSMTGAPLAAAVEAAQQIVGQCGPEDYVGLVLFDGVVEQRVPILPMDEIGRHRVVDALTSVQPGQGTNLHQAVRVGVSAVSRLLMPGRKGRILLLTDGEPSVGPEAPSAFRALGQEVAQSGVGLHPVGLGSHYVPEILSELARPSGNAFGHADGPEGLSMVMGGVFSLLYGEAATDTCIRILPQGLKLLELRHRYPSTAEGGSMWIKMGGLARGQVRRALFSGTPDNPSWSAEITGVTLEHGDQRHRRVEVTRAWPDSDEGRLVRSVSVELDLLDAEAQAWQMVLSGDGRALGWLERAESHLRELVALDVREIPRRRHLERLADLRVAVERGEGNLALLARRARAASEHTHISQVIPLPVPKLSGRG